MATCLRTAEKKEKGIKAFRLPIPAPVVLTEVAQISFPGSSVARYSPLIFIHTCSYDATSSRAKKLMKGNTGCKREVAGAHRFTHTKKKKRGGL